MIPASLADVSATPAIEFIDVRKNYGAHQVLRGVSFAVRRGEILGLLGPNGCGKTTTLRLIAGFLSPDTGEVRVCGEAIAGGSLQARGRIGYLPEKAPLYDALRATDYLDFVAAAKGLAGAAKRRAIDAAIDAFGLAAVAKRPIGTYSKGYRQRVGLAQATLGDPEVLLLDEATNGLDALQIVEVRTLIRKGSEGRAVIFCSHLMQEVAALCDRVLVLHEGRPLEMPPADDELRVELRMSGAQPEALLRAATAVPGVLQPTCRSDGGVITLRCRLEAHETADSLARAVLAQGRLLSLHPLEPSLEERFIEAIQRSKSTGVVTDVGTGAGMDAGMDAARP